MWSSIYRAKPFEELPWFSPDPSPEVVAAVADRFLPPKSPVLDVGCGAGSNVLYLAREGFEAHGVDLAPEAVRSAQARADREHLRVEVRVADALDLPYARGRFVGLVDHGCFHTLPIARRAEYAREAARVVRRGGAFLLSWIGREQTTEFGPPHRPSLAEVTAAFEAEFLFERTTFEGPGRPHGLATYRARLRRRSRPQPRRR